MDLYSGRAGKPLSELDCTDLSDLGVRRVITELKTYHLPPMFEIASNVRTRVPLVGEFDVAMWNNRVHFCPACGKRRCLYGDPPQCLACWDEQLRDAWDAGDRPYGCTEFRDCQSKRHVELKAMQPVDLGRDYDEEPTWSNPKVTFLATEVGCRICGVKLDWRSIGWFWSADSTGWGQGACPNCQDYAPGNWFNTEVEYRQWQDEYTAVRRIHRTVERYGAMSMLLVSPSPYWANWVTGVLPTGAAVPENPVLGKQVAHLRRPMKRPRTMAELGITVDSALRPRPSRPNVLAHLDDEE